MLLNARICRIAASGFAPMARWLVTILACVPMGLSAAQSLTLAENFAADAVRLKQDAKPMLVLFSQRGCTWCEEARRYLVPMSTAAESRDKALFRQIDIDSDAPLVDFDGSGSTHRAFARNRNIRLTPTVVLFAPDGSALGEAIVGMRLPDFYGQYLINAIEAGRAKLNKLPN